MATASDVVKRAFQLIGVQASEAPLQAAELVDGIDALNDLMAEWRARIDIGYEAVSAGSDRLNIDDYVEDIALAAIKPNLAIKLAPEYDKQISGTLASQADTTYKALLHCVVDLGPLEFPDTLPTGSGNYGTRFFR